jgi:hypothetical protein
LTWDATFCRPTQSVAEPGSATLEVTTDIGYDSFGNVSSAAVTGKKPDGTSMASRTTSISYADGTYPTGQFPLSVTQTVSSSFVSDQLTT